MRRKFDGAVNMPPARCSTLRRVQGTWANLAFFKYSYYTKTFTVPAKCCSVYCPVQEVREVVERASARIIIDLNPATSVRLAALLQS